MVDLGTLGGSQSLAGALNDSGQVVVGSAIGGDLESHATLWLSVVTVSIDITPGSYPNSINPKSKGQIPLAILATDTFDPTTVPTGCPSPNCAVAAAGCAPPAAAPGSRAAFSKSIILPLAAPCGESGLVRFQGRVGRISGKDLVRISGTGTEGSRGSERCWPL